MGPGSALEQAAREALSSAAQSHERECHEHDIHCPSGRHRPRFIPKPTCARLQIVLGRRVLVAGPRSRRPHGELTEIAPTCATVKNREGDLPTS